ncbi:hypothetical protein BJ170DRAFT_362388 [Xylariales sp. AK1849]|nr:hypothetical protein BJ170DRAFT_362388 [Xylariales sp. AK1849]
MKSLVLLPYLFGALASAIPAPRSNFRTAAPVEREGQISCSSITVFGAPQACAHGREHWPYVPYFEAAIAACNMGQNASSVVRSPHEGLKNATYIAAVQRGTNMTATVCQDIYEDIVTTCIIKPDQCSPETWCSGGQWTRGQEKLTIGVWVAGIHQERTI